MKSGSIVEYIDKRRVVCGVILEQKKDKFRVFTQDNREVTLGQDRLIHFVPSQLDISIGREALVHQLQVTAEERERLQKQVDVEALWDVVHLEPEWIDLPEMVSLCFDGQTLGDHASAIMRALFDDQLYFKFDTNRFLPNSRDRVAQIVAQRAEEAKKARILDQGSAWIQKVQEGAASAHPSEAAEIIDILKSCHLLGKNSPHYKIGKELICRSGLDQNDGPFEFLVKLGIWTEDENLTYHRFGLSEAFSPEVVDASGDMLFGELASCQRTNRRDLRDLSTLTIDGQSTLDFDDALSIERKPGGYRLGVHITDVAHFVKRGDPVDREALRRASSIYMPDQRIPMLPPVLTEDLCSLRKGEDRYAISIIVDLGNDGDVIAFDIFPSIINVKRQITYHDANREIESDSELRSLHELAKLFKKRRLSADALQLDLPEVSVWANNNGSLALTRTNRDSPSRLLVSECMILGNWLAACYLRDHGQVAPYRCQSPPRERLFGDGGATLFQQWMQRRYLSRMILFTRPEPHSGLGLEAYVTLTSPLRRYLDLVTQRQMRSLLGFEQAYTNEDLTSIIGSLEQPMGQVTFIQRERAHYWILKYLKGRVGQIEEALVLERRRHKHILLLPEYMIECTMLINFEVNNSVDLMPEDKIKVRIESVDPRADTLSVTLV